MIFTQYYLECLSQASYLIGDQESGRAVIVDPRRDVQEYLQDAEASGLSIEMIIETHFHADFCTGHLELAHETGADIAYSSVAQTEFESRGLTDGERISLGSVELEILHTPGHTPESMSIVVRETSDAAPYAVLTGDTLFIGDVGRPDLLSSVGFTSEQMAELLWDSLQNKLLPLPDETLVYPAHGAGSSCGKNLSTHTFSTLGEQRSTNYALLAEDKESFVSLVVSGQSSAPAYFAYDAEYNRIERPLLEEDEAPASMSRDEVDRAVESGAVIVDARSPDDFAKAHLAGSINVGLGGRFAEFAGSVVASNVDIILVANAGDELEAKNRLARIGFDRVIGCLANVGEELSTDQAGVIVGGRMNVAELTTRLDEVQVVDVRNRSETALGLVPGSVTIPLGEIAERLSELDADLSTVVLCAGGYRSSIGASLLRRAGFDDVVDLVGGYGAWASDQ